MADIFISMYMPRRPFNGVSFNALTRSQQSALMDALNPFSSSPATFVSDMMRDLDSYAPVLRVKRERSKDFTEWSPLPGTAPHA